MSVLFSPSLCLVLSLSNKGPWDPGALAISLEKLTWIARASPLPFLSSSSLLPPCYFCKARQPVKTCN